MGHLWQSGPTDPIVAVLRKAVAALSPTRGAEVLRLASMTATGEALVDLLGTPETPGTITSLPPMNQVRALQSLVEKSAGFFDSRDVPAVVRAVDALPADIGADLQRKVARD